MLLLVCCVALMSAHHAVLAPYPVCAEMECMLLWLIILKAFYLSSGSCSE
jgi:hypothetical protein